MPTVVPCDIKLATPISLLTSDRSPPLRDHCVHLKVVSKHGTTEIRGDFGYYNVWTLR